jgi:hypothetical protein
LSLIRMPCCENNSLDSVDVLLHVQRSGDSGSPLVSGSTSVSSISHTSGCAASYERVPPLRRIFTTSAGVIVSIHNRSAFDKLDRLSLSRALTV